MRNRVDVEVDVTRADLGDHMVLVLSANDKPTKKPFKDAAALVTAALQQSAYREGVKDALGHIDVARMCFAAGVRDLSAGKKANALKELQMGTVVLEKNLRELCEQAGVKLPNLPEAK